MSCNLKAHSFQTFYPDDIYLTAHHLVIFLYPFDFMIKMPTDPYYEIAKFIYENHVYIEFALITTGVACTLGSIYWLAEDAHKKN